jgi:hypothetical protein
MMKVPLPTRAQDYQVDDPCYDIGGGDPPIGIKVKRSFMSDLKGYNGVILTFVVVSIKNEDSSVNHLSQSNPLHQ